MHRLSVLVFLLHGLGTSASAAPLTYEADVRPILKAHCFPCHGEAGQKEGRLDVRLKRFLVSGGDSGAAIVPGQPEKSLLIERIEAGEMPPENKHPVEAEDLNKLKEWIAQERPPLVLNLKPLAMVRCLPRRNEIGGLFNL